MDAGPVDAHAARAWHANVRREALRCDGLEWSIELDCLLRGIGQNDLSLAAQRHQDGAAGSRIEGIVAVYAAAKPGKARRVADSGVDAVVLRAALNADSVSIRAAPKADHLPRLRAEIEGCGVRRDVHAVDRLDVEGVGAVVGVGAVTVREDERAEVGRG